MSIAGTAHGASFSANTWGVCSLEGDFDVEVDFQLATWPSRRWRCRNYERVNDGRGPTDSKAASEPTKMA